VGRQWIEGSDLDGSEMQLPSRVTRGLNTLQMCVNPTCALVNVTMPVDWGEGNHDIVSSPDRTTCQQCSEDQRVQQLMFTDCPFSIKLCEVFNNGRKKLLDHDACSRGKVTVFRLPGHYSRLEVSTLSQKNLTAHTAGTTQGDSLSIDDNWLNQFAQHCDDVQSISLRDIMTSLGPVVSTRHLEQLRQRTRQKRLQWYEARKGAREFTLDFPHGHGSPARKLVLPQTAEESMLLLYLYTLQQPSLYSQVSAILNSPSTRVEDIPKVQAVMPFVKGVMGACSEVMDLNPALRYGPATAYRGMANFRYSEYDWSKFQPGNQICWYTVKSVTTTEEGLRTFLGDAGVCTIFQIVDCTGTIIKPFSEFSEEDEVLLMPGTRFDVVQAQRSSALESADILDRADFIILRMLI